MEKKRKKTFLVVYDYGQGGIWFLMDARSKDEIEILDENFKAFEDRPNWMEQEEKLRYISRCQEKGFHWDIDKEPTGWLADFFLNKKRNRQ